MTKANFTSINVVLDRSGSMETIADDVIGGFNTFIQEQKKVPGEAIFTLAQFDDQYEVVYDCAPIADVKELTKETYVPRGSTALLDAIARTVNNVGSKLASMKEEDRPSKVIFLVSTDGQENASREFTHAKVKEMVEHQTTKYNWTFIFMGASGMDAIAQGTSMGFTAGNSYNFKKSKMGTQKLYKNISDSMTASRTTGQVFSMDAKDILDDTDTNTKST